MSTVKATLSNFRQSPRKMRIVANLVRGKKVSDVLINLDFVAKKSSLPIKKLILSALANAKNLDIPIENLFIKTIKVDGGAIMYRRLPASRGSAHKMRKRICSVFVELGTNDKVLDSKKVVKEKKTEVVAKKSTIKKPTKKPTKKTLESKK